MLAQLKEGAEDLFWKGYLVACLPLIWVLDVWDCDNKYMD